MKLTATISRVDGASGYEDGQQRVFLKVNQADGNMYNEIKLPNTDSLQLDQELVVLVLRQDEALELSATMDANGIDLNPLLASLADQLRPDEPPPFLAATVETSSAQSLSTAQSALYVGRDGTTAAEKLLVEDDFRKAEEVYER